MLKQTQGYAGAPKNDYICRRVPKEAQDILLISHLNYHLDSESEHSKSTMKCAHSADFSVVDLRLW